MNSLKYLPFVQYLVLFNFHLLSTFLRKELWTIICEFKFLAFAQKMNETAIWKYLTIFIGSLLYEFNAHTNNNFSNGLGSDTRTWAHRDELHCQINLLFSWSYA